MEGWIKIHRKMIDWEWFDEPNTFKLFMYLMLTCNFKPTRWRGKELGIGETIKGIEFLAEATHMSVQNIRTAISHLKSTGELTERWHGKYRILKLKNYQLYQIANTDTNSELTVNQQRTNSELTADKECKKNKNDKNVKKIAVAIIFWEKNIGLLNEHTCNELVILEGEHGEANLVQALKVAVEAGKRSLRYVKGILDNERGNNYSWEKLPKSIDEPLLKKVPPAIRKQVEKMMEDFVRNTGTQPKEKNIKIMIERITHEKVK